MKVPSTVKLNKWYYLKSIKPSLANYSMFIGIFEIMQGNITNSLSSFPKKYIVLDMRNSYTCSFTEFLPFCIKLYYFSNFKDFNTLPQA
jgi:hypothetical protein